MTGEVKKVRKTFRDIDYLQEKIVENLRFENEMWYRGMSEDQIDYHIQQSLDRLAEKLAIMVRDR